MSETSEKICLSHCYNCNKSTRHTILADESYCTSPDSYYEKFNYQIVCCRGCGQYGFRIVETDFEARYYNKYGEEECATYEKIYPKYITPNDDYYYLPDTVYRIHSETILAINEESYTLAAIGLRATLEAICQDKELKGENLEERIEKLLSQGFITKRDRDFLHSIRFLGNDAAHEIIKAEKSQIEAALTIIEYLIENIYIIEKKIEGKLPSFYDRFLKSLPMKIQKLGLTGEFSLHTIENMPENQFNEFTQKLVNDIQNGKVDFIELSGNKYNLFKIIQKN